jgi:hypothetical protein
VKIQNRRSRVNTLAPTGRGLSKVMKEIRWFTHFVVAVCLVIPVAGLVPGDAVNLNVIGSLGLIVMLIAADLVITVPLTVWIKRLGKPVLAPVGRGSRW